jgi:hypothetical protein
VTAVTESSILRCPAIRCPFTTNTNVKVRYESYEEVRAALLEEGINTDQLPMLEDMRPPEEQERN